MRLAVALGIKSNMNRVVAIFAVLLVASACTAERALTPPLVQAPSAQEYLSAAPLEPLLFVVDGVKYQRDQLPLITTDRIFAVRVIKGRAALEQYGKDASYGVVIITTRQGAGRRA